MNDIQIFRNDEFGEVRTVMASNEPWFVGNDVAIALGYSQTAKAVREHVDTEDKGVSVLDTPGGKQQVTIINESGLYSLILSSKLPSAKKFKRWVTSEVLPSIRKTGGYMVAKQDDTPETIMARAVLIAQDTMKRQKEQIESLQRQNKQITAQNVNKRKKHARCLDGIRKLPTFAAFNNQMWSRRISSSTKKGGHFLCPTVLSKSTRVCYMAYRPLTS